MSIVTIFAASFCNGAEIAKNVAEELGYELLGEEVLERAAKRLGCTAAKLELAMAGRPGGLDRVFAKRELQVAAIRVALVEAIKEGDVVYQGLAGHLIPRTVAHALQVCVLANRSHRVAAAMKSGMSQKKALRAINQDDEDYGRWTEYLLDTHQWDKAIYDVKIPIHQQSIEEATAIICELARRPEIHESPGFEQTLEDFALGSKVGLRLAEAGIRDAAVLADERTITVHVSNPDTARAKIEKIVKSLDGVDEVTVAAHEEAPAKDDKKEDKARKVLLVDDEEEFAHTLSQRLQVREYESSVALDGEEALAAVEKGTEVIVVDLHMPGIDGYEVLEKAKERNPDTEVIVLTGHGSEEARAKALKLGAFAFLEKPVKIEELTRIMNEAYEHIERRKAK